MRPPVPAELDDFAATRHAGYDLRRQWPGGAVADRAAERGGLGYNVAVSFNELLQNLFEDTAADGTAPPAESRPAGEGGADFVPSEVTGDVSPAEAAAFEATVSTAPAAMTVTASVDQTADELLDLFNGNDW